MDLSNYGFRPDFDENNRVVKQEEITIDGKELFVSTVDLGLNHRFGEGTPLYFETMIFPKDAFNDLYCNRYETREQALEYHELLINDLRCGSYELKDGYFQFHRETEEPA